MLRYWTGTRPRSGEDSRITCEGRLEHRDLHLAETEDVWKNQNCFQTWSIEIILKCVQTAAEILGEPSIH